MSNDLLEETQVSAEVDLAHAELHSPGKIRKILSIDGGGIKGMFAATFLAEMEENTREPLWRHFDLITGTSTGGIIALGLALGIPAARIRDLYETEGPGIFAQERQGLAGAIDRKVATFRHRFFGTKYASIRLRHALEDVFGDRRVSEAKTRLMVPAFHHLTKKVHIFKTFHADRLTTDYKDTALDVAMSTSAAPTYFRAHLTNQDVGLVDGGVWANNPTGLAVVEAIGTLGWERKNLRVLNVGCLDETSELPGKGSALGMFVGQHLLAFFSEGQAKGSLGIAQVLTGDVGGAEHKAIYRVINISPDLFAAGSGYEMKLFGLPVLRMGVEVGPGEAEPITVHLGGIVNINLIHIWIVVEIVAQDISGLALNSTDRGELHILPSPTALPVDQIVLAINAKANVFPVDAVCPAHLARRRTFGIARR